MLWIAFDIICMVLSSLLGFILMFGFFDMNNLFYLWLGANCFTLTFILLLHLKFQIKERRSEKNNERTNN